MDDYDDWIDRLDPHARQRFEWMNGRITELTNGWRAADAERDAALRETARLVAAIGAALGAYDDWLHRPHTAAAVAHIIKPLTDALEGRPT